MQSINISCAHDAVARADLKFFDAWYNAFKRRCMGKKYIEL